uniref:Uncharacterized protein LOC105125640 n=1 Tax=Rhizophora mucronata TaxID=61149 RepID=A0A2P2JCS9_RHIMU
MLARRLVSFFRNSPKSQLSSNPKPADEGKSNSVGRKAVSFMLITVTGGVALSALDDLAIYHGCSSKAMEKASNNQEIKDAIGEPVVKGPWYSASLAVAHKRHSLSCSFPVSGPHGDGVLQFKAVRNGDGNWLSFFLPREWDILVLDALLHIPANEGKDQTLRISVLPTIACKAGTQCRLQEPEQPEKK